RELSRANCAAHGCARRSSSRDSAVAAARASRALHRSSRAIATDVPAMASTPTLKSVAATRSSTSVKPAQRRVLNTGNKIALPPRLASAEARREEHSVADQRGQGRPPPATQPLGIGNREWGIGRTPPPPWGIGNREWGNRPPHATPPLGIGNREWGIDKAFRPLPPPPFFINSRESASPFPRFPIPDSRFPRAGRWGVDHSPFPRFPISDCRFPREGQWGVERFPSALQSTLTP